MNTGKLQLMSNQLLLLINNSHSNKTKVKESKDLKNMETIINVMFLSVLQNKFTYFNCLPGVFN